MERKILLSILVIFFLALAINLVDSQTSYCCEKTVEGAWCQNEEADKCNSNFRKAPTSCEATSYCKLGTCIDNQEGICLPNTPQRVCEENNGYWENKPLDEISQCQLGCCLIGDQSSFVTQTRCKALASNYGLEADYRGNIQDEVQCIASANPHVKGACVYEEDFVNKCKFTTKKECQSRSPTSLEEEETFLDSIRNNEPEEETPVREVRFHEGFLCSAESLGTICGPSEETTCEKERVYFLDTCGNLANIYDASKVNDGNYWTYVRNVDESCGYDDLGGNKESKTCGNCDYYSGSICKPHRQANSPIPTYGDYICASLDCKDSDFSKENGRDPQHGERWCVTNTGEDLEFNVPGTEHFVFECRDGEVEVYDECSVGEFRGMMCLEDEVNGFKNARCGINQWRDCLEQETEEECLDSEIRDCNWIEGYSILKNDEGRERKLEDLEEEKVYASCVPKFSPAFDFWKPETQAVEWCSVASDVCIVEFEVGVFRNRKNLEDASQKTKIKKCVRNCYCLEGYDGKDAQEKFLDILGKEEWTKHTEKDDYFDSYEDWISTMSSICSSVGDCGTTENYLGKEGYFKEGDNIETEFFAKPKELEEGSE